MNYYKDADSTETQEWLEAYESVIKHADNLLEGKKTDIILKDFDEYHTGNKRIIRQSNLPAKGNYQNSRMFF